MAQASEIHKKALQGLQICTLNEILFPVEMINNPQPANTEYQHIVRGYGDFKINAPEYVEVLKKVERGVDKGKTVKVIKVSYPTKKVNVLDLNYCSHRYELVPNEDIFPPVIDVLNKNGIDYKATFMHMNYARFYAEFVIKGHEFKVGNEGDIIFPMLKVQHSYNGLTEYRITFGYYRLVCSNGLVLPVAEKSQFNINLTGKHTKAIHMSLLKLDEAIKFFLSQGKKPMQNFEVLGGIMVTDIEGRAKEVLKAAKVNIIDNAKFNTMTYLRERIAKDQVAIFNREYDTLTDKQKKVNEWLLYNAINHYIYNNEKNKAASPKQREDKDSAVLRYMLKDAGVL